ncbi:MAG: hypothetical protein IKY23_05505 [Lachnospiraceae bacterium]|nr:hypothetical protein [Lachnospiraceae bacterium]
MNPTDLVIDAHASLGRTLLTDVSPVFEYKNNVRTDTLLGYKYEVALPEHNLDKVWIKINGKKLMDAPQNSFCEVIFDGLELFLYTMQGRTHVGARATGISLVNTK